MGDKFSTKELKVEDLKNIRVLTCNDFIKMIHNCKGCEFKKFCCKSDK